MFKFFCLIGQLLLKLLALASTIGSRIDRLCLADYGLLQNGINIFAEIRPCLFRTCEIPLERHLRSGGIPSQPSSKNLEQTIYTIQAIGHGSQRSRERRDSRPSSSKFICYATYGIRQRRCATRGAVDRADKHHELIAQLGECLANRDRHFCKVAINLLSNFLQRSRNDFGCQLTFGAHVAQGAARNTKAVRNGLRQRRRLFHDAVEFFAAQRARGKALPKLHQRGLGGLRRCTGYSDGLANRRNDADRLVCTQANAFQCRGKLRVEIDRSAQVGARSARRIAQRIHRVSKIAAVLRSDLEFAGHLAIGIGKLDDFGSTQADTGERQRTGSNGLQRVQLLFKATNLARDAIKARRTSADQQFNRANRHSWPSPLRSDKFPTGKTRRLHGRG